MALEGVGNNQLWASGTSVLFGTIVRVASAFVAPVVVLLLAEYLAPRLIGLPPTLAGLRTWGPMLTLVLAGGLALAFNRGRALFGIASLAVAFVAFKLQVQAGTGTFAGRTVFGALCIFVPLNLAALVLLRERGIFSFYGLRRGGTIALQALVVAWIVAEQRTGTIEWLYQPLLADGFVPGSPIPQVALMLTLAGVIAATLVAVTSRTAIDAAFAGALTAFALACHNVALPNHFAVYAAAAGAILGIGVLHDAFRLAFRDELTGLPSRRALNERMMALGHHYAIAMADVDHFKSFNDTWGHELGDQVLKLIAGKLEQVGGGGRAYRYGGEEFTILFPGKNLREAWPHLEAVRQGIAGYRLAIRGRDRPMELGVDGPQRGIGNIVRTVSVTVSIGVAQRDERNTTPAEVLIAADRSLYRAKEKGRNRVSR
jgi:diguanylate cyclase (GGDEF)-like protein